MQRRLFIKEHFIRVRILKPLVSKNLHILMKLLSNKMKIEIFLIFRNQDLKMGVISLVLKFFVRQILVTQ